MTYSSMANFQGEGGVDTAPKKEKKQVSTIANDYQNYSYTPLEQEVDTPTYEDNTDTKEPDNLGFGSSPSGEFGGAGLGAKPVTPTPTSGGGDNEDDTQSNSYLTDVTTNLINAASGSIPAVKKFFGYEDKDTDKDFDSVYDEYVELYMPPELKAKNVPLGPKGVLSNYVPYVTTYNIGGEDSAIPQESLVDSRGEFPYTDEYRARIKTIIDTDNARRQAILDDAELIKKSDELGISTKKALELYYDSISSLVTPKPAFERIQVADSGAGFGALFDEVKPPTTTTPGLQGFLAGNQFSDEASVNWEDQGREVVIKGGKSSTKIEPEVNERIDWGAWDREGKLKDIANVVKPLLKKAYKNYKGEGSLIDYSIGSTTTEGAEKSKTKEEIDSGFDTEVKISGITASYTTPNGFDYSLYSDYNDNAKLSFKYGGVDASIDNDGNAYVGFQLKFGGAR